MLKKFLLYCMQVQNIGFKGLDKIETKSETKKSKSNLLSVSNSTDVISKEGNAAILNAALAGLNISKTSTIVHGGKEYRIDGKYKVIGEMPTSKANAEWASRGYTDMPYKEGKRAQIIELKEDCKFVRTYDNKNSYKAGSWVMKYEDVKGLSAKEIADKFALPQVPTMICDCTLPKGTKIRTGECNPLYGWNGGGQQFDLMGERVGNFDNEREIGEKVA